MPDLTTSPVKSTAHTLIKLASNGSDTPGAGILTMLKSPLGAVQEIVTLARLPCAVRVEARPIRATFHT